MATVHRSLRDGNVDADRPGRMEPQAQEEMSGGMAVKVTRLEEEASWELGAPFCPTPVSASSQGTCPPRTPRREPHVIETKGSLA